jgi:hypothetical protein
VLPFITISRQGVLSALPELPSFSVRDGYYLTRVPDPVCRESAECRSSGRMSKPLMHATAFWFNHNFIERTLSLCFLTLLMRWRSTMHDHAQRRRRVASLAHLWRRPSVKARRRKGGQGDENQSKPGGATPKLPSSAPDIRAQTLLSQMFQAR